MPSVVNGPIRRFSDVSGAPTATQRHVDPDPASRVSWTAHGHVSKPDVAVSPWMARRTGSVSFTCCRVPEAHGLLQENCAAASPPHGEAL